MKKLILFGNGKQAKVIYKILLAEGVAADGFCVDEEYHNGDAFLDKPLYKTEDFFSKCSPEEYLVFLPLSAKNRCEFRKSKFCQFDNQGYEFFTFISKWAFLYSDKKVGRNVFIGAGAVIHPDATIEDNCYISECAGLGHDAVLGSHCFVGPRASILASCSIGDCVTFGACALVRENLHIASGSVLGMGISIHRNIDKAGIYLFSPLEEEHFGRLRTR